MLRAVLVAMPAVAHGRPDVDLNFAALNAASVGGDGVLLGPARGAWPLMPPRSAQRFPSHARRRRGAPSAFRSLLVYYGTFHSVLVS